MAGFTTLFNKIETKVPPFKCWIEDGEGVLVGYENQSGQRVLFPAGVAQNALTAFAGGGQASAVQLKYRIARVTTVATAADSVILPFAKAGMQMTVINAAAANAMDVFPATGDIINALSANTALSVAANKAIVFTCAVDGTWNTNLTA